MSEIIIAVRGEHEVRVAPERAVAHVTAVVDGSDRGQVVEALAAVAEPLRRELEARRAAGGLVEWSSARAAVWSERPWNAEGRQLAPVHHASVDVEATFEDFPALSHWLDTVAGRADVRIGHIEWQLRPDTRDTVERETATAAVGAAIRRAEAYASALGHTTVTALEIADAGLRQPAPPQASPLMARASFAAEPGGPAIDVRPADIVVTAAVEARFRAG